MPPDPPEPNVIEVANIFTKTNQIATYQIIFP